MEQKVARKRELTQDLQLVRSQKAEVLRQLQQIAKKQRSMGLPIKVELSPEEKRVGIEAEHKRRTDTMWQACTRIVQELLKAKDVLLWFGQAVDERFAPGYYSLIKRPMDLNVIKRELPGAGQQFKP